MNGKTPYADSLDIVNARIYDRVTAMMAHTPDGWGRYFNAPSDNGTGGYYHPASEGRFFHEKRMRLLPIGFQQISVNDYATGYHQAQLNLQAALEALGNNATSPFYYTRDHHYCAFMLDAETHHAPPSFVFTDYLHGWLTGMEDGVKDPLNRVLTGWPGIYSAQDACNTWTSVIHCASQYHLRPKFIAVASWIADLTPTRPAFPTWNLHYTSSAESCRAIGQATVLWQ